MNESSILKLDESMRGSMVAGVENLIGGDKDAAALDLNKIEGNFSLNPVVVQEKPETKAAEVGGGRVKGWKERLAKLREQKEQEKKVLEDTKLNQSVDTSLTEDVDKLKDIVGPAKGLERDKDGKLSVDKDKVEEKKDPVLSEPKKTPEIPKLALGKTESLPDK